MKEIHPDTIRRLMVRTTNWIGDAVMTVPALHALRETFPQACITVVANPLVAQLFEYHPACHEVLVFDKQGAHAGTRGFLGFVAQLRGQKFDGAVLFQNALEAAILAFMAGIPRRIGYATDGRKLLLTHAVAIGGDEKRLHHTDYYLHMLAQVGITPEVKTMALALRPEERAWATGVLPAGQIAAINPGAAYGSAKRWIPERFAAVADRLSEDYGLSIILTGGPGEVEIGNDIAHSMRQPCLNFIGTTGVRQMMALLASCRLVVTNDSGPMHVAAAFGTPLVAIFGPTDHTTTSPWSEHARVVRHPVECSPCLLRQCPIDHRCMERLTVDDVMNAVAELLQEAG